MSDKYAVEVLLRPAVEIYSAVVCLSCAIIMFTLPEVLWMPKKVAQGSAIVLIVFALYDYSKAKTIWDYRSRMKRTPIYKLAIKNVPKQNDKLYLGRGFRWTQAHTQRLSDTYEARYNQFIHVTDSHDRFERLRHLPVLRKLINADSALNPFRPPSPTGGNPAVHAVGMKERSIFIPNKARKGNMLVLGTTGAGKTRWIEWLVSQDINNPEKQVVIVIDPKGDAELLSRMYIESERAGRLSEFHIFHIGFPELSERYNSIGNFSRITEVATRIANQLPDSGNSATFKEFAWRFLNIAARALNELGERPDYRDMRSAIDDVEPLMIRYMDHYFKNNGEEKWRQRIEEGLKGKEEENLPKNFLGRSVKGYVYYTMTVEHGDEISDLLISDLAACIKYEKSYYDKLVSSVGPLMEKLTTGKAGELLSPDYFDMSDVRPILDWRTVIREGGVVYVGLDALSDPTVAGAVGQSMMSDLTSIAGEIYKYGPFAGMPRSDDEDVKIRLHLDEVNELISDEFIPLVNKCRGAGMDVTAYTQAVEDIETKVGVKSKAEQIMANFNNLGMMRVRNKATAQILCEQLPDVNIDTVMTVSGVTDNDYSTGNHFTSRNEDRISAVKTSMLEPSTLTQLPDGQAFVLIEGGRLYKLRIPLPISTKQERELPTKIDQIVSQMRRRSSAGASNDWAEEEPWWNIVDATDAVSKAQSDKGAA